jgi:hypothetical protein
MQEKKCILKYLVEGRGINEGLNYVAIDDHSGGYPYRTDLTRCKRFATLDEAVKYAGKDLSTTLQAVELTIDYTEKVIQGPRYEVVKTRCNCHPETCGCYDWTVVDNTVNRSLAGHKIAAFMDKDKAAHLADLLNRNVIDE